MNDKDVKTKQYDHVTQSQSTSDTSCCWQRTASSERTFIFQPATVGGKHFGREFAATAGSELARWLVSSR